MREVTFPETLTIIKDWAFNTTSIEELIIPDSVVEIGASAFGGLRSMTHLSLSRNLTVIEEDAFGACEVLETLEIYSGVTTIKNRAFWACYCLRTLVLPSTLEYMSDGAFAYANSLESATFGNSENWYYATNEYYVDDNGESILHYDLTDDQVSVSSTPENNTGLFSDWHSAMARVNND